MLVYLLLGLLFFLIIYAFGFLCKEFLGRFGIAHFSFKPVEIFLLGFVGLSILSSYLSIFIPLSLKVTVAFVLIGLIGLIIKRNRFKAHLLRLKKLKRIDKWIVSILLIAICAVSAKGLTNYDSGLYRVQSIKWIQNYAMVPGLANLHGRFGFNSLFFTVSAPFSINGSFANTDWLVFPLNSLCLAVFAIWQYFNIKSALLKSDRLMAGFDLILLILSLSFLTNWLGSPTPDIICALLSLMVFRLLMDATDSLLKNRLLISILVATCVAYKLSTILLMLLPLLLIRRSHLIKDLSWIALLYLIVLLPFFYRNYFLSGYLVYPFYALDLFDPLWKVPLTKTIEEQIWIKSWARIPGENAREVLNMGFAQWIPLWFKALSFLDKVMLIFSGLLPFMHLFSFRKLSRRTNFLILILLANLLFWFFQAPDPRFAIGFLILATAFVLFVLLEKIPLERLKRSVQIGFFAMLTYMGGKTFVDRTIGRSRENIRESQLIIPAGFDIEPSEMNYRKESGNFDYFVPQQGDRCFNAPLPCTPYPRESLSLRGEGFQDGFAIAGRDQKGESESNPKD